MSVTEIFLVWKDFICFTILDFSLTVWEKAEQLECTECPSPSEVSLSSSNSDSKAHHPAWSRGRHSDA